MGSLEELSGWFAAAIAAATSIYQAYTGRKKDAEHRVDLAQEREERFPRIVVERSFARPAQVDLALALRNEQPHDRSLITLVGYSALDPSGRVNNDEPFPNLLSYASFRNVGALPSIGLEVVVEVRQFGLGIAPPSTSNALFIIPVLIAGQSLSVSFKNEIVQYATLAPLPPSLVFPGSFIDHPDGPAKSRKIKVSSTPFFVSQYPQQYLK